MRIIIKRIVLGFFLLFVIFITSVSIYAEVVESRSYSSKIYELVFRLTSSSEAIYDEEEAESYLEKKYIDNQTPPRLPWLLYQTDVKNNDDNDMISYTFTPDNLNEDKIIIFFPGGGYVNPPRSVHFRFVDRIANATGYKAIIPMYPLAPEYSYQDAYKKIEHLYESIISANPDAEIIFVGDSSGAGLALGFAQMLNEKNAPTQPSQLILMSPWLDISLSNPLIPEYQKRDPFLNSSAAIFLGDAWRKDAPVDYYKVSPLYGDLNGLGTLTIFAGTHDILYPDTLLLQEKALKNDIELNHYAYDKMNHGFYLFPFVREAEDVFSKIVDTILAS